MFNNDKYITKGIQESIPLELQLFMWNSINSLKNKDIQLDYLQVFTLTKPKYNEQHIQIIEHRQEIPEHKRKYKLNSINVINAKIFVIDSGEYSTMMLSEEY
ncbi:DUF960 family protein [Clostridium manihotivorum]|uniref:DUF960 domain-containing protein n=1 Tax=Clostridium manihotivorum TaxID=2320868 RepID=A0A3R5QR66_9CLOT|nr:DUF960 family protein [Clostridium manihotivorum]QAA30357.1 hypothetical protein C1I91_00915 [Clostridium manihotivorum]